MAQNNKISKNINALNASLLISTSLIGATLGAISGVRQRFLPKIKGSYKLVGLEQEVEVIRDKWGVPHLYAQNELDLLFAQGFVQAQDRLWQMEFNRRLPAGQLAEIAGSAALPIDKFMRRIGLARQVETELKTLEPEDLKLLEAYSAGVNAFIQLGKLPLEFLFLRFKPNQWQPRDSLLWGKMMSWSLAQNWEQEFLRAKLVERVGPEIAAHIESLYAPGYPLVVSSEIDYKQVSDLAEEVLTEFNRLRELTGLGASGNGSNNWVIAGNRTTTGKPLLANDPHLANQMPGVWYNMHLHCPAAGLDVIGASLPATPYILIGHNQHLAWGMTNVMADNQDLFVEKVDRFDAQRYLYKGQWRKMEIVEERIKVKGQADVIEKVACTVHGPLINGLLGQAKNVVPSADSNSDAQNWPLESQVGNLSIALGWTGQLFGTKWLPRNLNKARNWPEFRESLRAFDGTPQNFVYADVEGNIGYQMAGLLPKRPKTASLLPVPGWKGDYDWRGKLEFDQLPTLFNPPNGFIVTANNKVVGDDYPHYITHEWMPGYRAARIRQLITAKPKLSLEDCCAMQADVYSEPGYKLAKILGQRLTTPDPKQSQALDYLLGWDGFLKVDSVAATLYEAVINRLLYQVFGPLAGELIEPYLGNSLTGISPMNALTGRAIPMILRWLEQDDSRILGGKTAWPQALAKALDQALERLEKTLGTDMSEWQWGRIHQASWPHVLGQVKPLDKIFNRGPYPVGGDAETIFAAAFVPVRQLNAKTFKALGWTSSFRQVVDLSELDRSVMSNSHGQAGTPFSHHYTDQINNWLHARQHPAIFNRADLKKHTEGTLYLKPQ
jgi:penicillin amidase